MVFKRKDEEVFLDEPKLICDEIIAWRGMMDQFRFLLNLSFFLLIDEDLFPLPFLIYYPIDNTFRLIQWQWSHLESSLHNEIEY